MVGLTRFGLPPYLQRGGIVFRFLLFLSFLLLMLVLYIARHPLLRLAGAFWVVDDAAVASDAIVVLGDDDFNGDRAARAAELYRGGWAPRIVASGRYLRPYASIAELEQHDLTNRGVPLSAVVRLAHRAENTREEAFVISRLISSRGWSRIIVVTSNYHTRRSRYICERAFPQGTSLRVVAARDSEYDPDNWWRTRVGLKIFVHELAGMVVAIWEMRHNGVQTADSGSLSRTHPMVADWYHRNALLIYCPVRLYYSFSTAEDVCQPTQRLGTLGGRI
ncbi:MAG TPA: YdcF family protein [Candidatus Acidoferrales bacterium]|nr:YdcF family protein [Candidatus Acidoferrales bacterium]